MVEILGDPFQVTAAAQARVDEGQRDHAITAGRVAGVPRAFQLEVQFARAQHEEVLNAVQKSVAKRKPPRVHLVWPRDCGTGSKSRKTSALPEVVMATATGLLPRSGQALEWPSLPGPLAAGHFSGRPGRLARAPAGQASCRRTGTAGSPSPAGGEPRSRPAIRPGSAVLPRLPSALLRCGSAARPSPAQRSSGLSPTVPLRVDADQVALGIAFFLVENGPFFAAGEEARKVIGWACRAGAGGLAARTARLIGVVAKAAGTAEAIGPGGPSDCGFQGEAVSRPITFQRRDRA